MYSRPETRSYRDNAGQHRWTTASYTQSVLNRFAVPTYGRLNLPNSDGLTGRTTKYDGQQTVDNGRPDTAGHVNNQPRVVNRYPWLDMFWASR